MRRLIILCFLFTFTAAAANDPKYISINCGGAAAATSLSGRWWSGDAAVKGSSTVATAKREVIIAVDRVPYQTARISRSQFSYSFRLNPGQKLIRLHFNPVSYEGFRSFNDLFTVEAGHFTLLANFSASITARALALDVIVKEFCIIIQENQLLYIVFSPETSQSGYNYAFINGIEIVSVPSTISYCHGGDSGIHVLGQKSVIYVDNTSVLERVYHQDVKWGYVLDDIVGMVGMWESSLKRRAKKASKVSWRVSVDVGFRYLVRIHLSKVGLKMDFAILIDDMIAFTTVDMLQQGGNKSILWYNYLVMVEGHKREGKREISISLNSQHEFLNKHGPLEGFELFKLSNHDRSLASPNPLPPRGDSASQTTQTLLHTLLGRRNVIATVVFILISLVNVIVHWLQKMWVSDEPDLTEEETKPSARAKRLCRHFSFAEIQSATENFDGALIIGKGGFGIVYRGLIDNRREIVAIKRSKPDSKQGELQFWTEVEMLSELRHVNLVTIIGYCIEQQEMIIVYEYMPYGSLADHLYKLARKSNAFYPLSWKQRLKICIGSSRALDYLHTGHGIIHRDVKASNILLDHKLVPKVSDFGLAKTGFDSESQCQDSTNLRGTFGYIDPNYFKTRKLTMKSDTYSFGVVLLEVLCGRRAVEPSEEEDKHSLTSWAIDNISKGQVDRIVAPSLRGEISTESLKTFVKVAEKCLHDEPKRRPTMAHIVIKLELALLQQEKAESFAAESTSVEDVLSSADKSQKNMHSLESNEKMNATDHLPKKENVSSSSHNEKPVSPSQMMSSFNVQADTSPLIELSKSTMINGGVKDGRKSLMRRISQKLWSQDVFRKTRKPSNKMDLVGITSVSAPVLRRTSNITLAGNTISVKRTHGEKNMSSLAPNEKMIAAEQLSEKEIMRSSSHDEKRNVTDGMPCTDNDITVLSVSPRPTLSSFNVQTDTSPPREQSNTTMINSGKNNGRKSLMHKISRKLWSQDAFWKTRNPSSKTDLVGIAASAPMLRRTSNLKMGGNTISDKRTDVMSSTPLRIFSFEELKVATRNFRGDSFLGQGGFGTVYKGWIHNKFGDKEKSRSTVAVKKLDLEGLQGFKEWQSEVEFLGRLTHPNLVKLFGYGWDDNLLFLVYEFMPKGTLEIHLFRRSLQPLPWDIRLKILIGAARGLAFLHSSEKVVIHRDFKSSNILLDESYNAKISDFGLAKDGPMGDHTHVSTMVMGTYGYAAPEYVATGHLTVKSDVYGYGVVLVEVLTGLRALDVQRPAGQHNLIEWMKPHLSNWRKLKKIVDPRMEGRYPSESTVQIAKLALDCLHPNPKSRPKMQRVVETLEGLVDIFVEKPRQPRVSFSPQL